jgi:hypothetical protein
MKSRMKNFWDEARRAAGALQYANSAEFLMQRDKEAVLRHGLGGELQTASRSAAAVMSAPAPQRRVALVAEQSLQPGALRYAVNVCERLSAQLELLAGPAVAAVEAAVSDACRENRIPWRVIPVGADCLAELAHYAKTAKGLLFVVASAEDAVVASSVEQRRGRRQRFSGRVPLVLVAGDLVVI